MLTFEISERKNSQGRPKTKLLDDIENDIKELVVKHWKQIQEERTLLKRVVQKAKTRVKGFRANYDYDPLTEWKIMN
jgi:hypothetical protein